MTEELHLEVRDGIAWLTVDRPAVRNALSAQICRDLVAKIGALADDKSVRVVVLRGGR